MYKVCAVNQKKKRKEKREATSKGKKKEKKNKNEEDQCGKAHPQYQDVQFFTSTFSPFCGENTWILPFIFLPLHPTKHTPKSFHFYFLSKFFYPSYFTSKKTHREFRADDKILA